MRTWFLIIIGCVGLSGCARKAGPIPGVGFVEEARMKRPEDLPFHKAWFKPGFQWGDYSQIQIAPVNIDHLPKMDWWKRLERGSAFQADAEKLAEYAKRTFEEHFRDDPNQRYRVVDQPDPETLILEIALVEIIPSKVVLNTLGYAPFVGSAVKLIRNTKGKSSVAFEARLRDGQTAEVVAMFADREFEKMSPLNVKDITWYGHAESIVAEWASQFVRMCNRKGQEAIPDSKPFHFKPW
jgi:hypothetical protein